MKFGVFRGFSVHVMLITALGFAATFAFLFLPKLIPRLETIWYITICFVFAGIFSAGTFVPGYVFYQKIAEINGICNVTQAKLLVTTWCNNLYAIGAVLGSTVLSGPLFQTFGFYISNLVICAAMLLFTILTALYMAKHKLYMKLYYDMVACDAVQSVPVTPSGESSSPPNSCSGQDSGFANDDSSDSVSVSSNLDVTLLVT